MNPNQQLSREQQIQFLAAQLDATRTKTDAMGAAMSEMRQAIAKLNDVGPVPSLSDVVKIASGMRLLVQSHLSVIMPDYEQMQKQVAALEKGLEELRGQGGLIHKATLIPPSMGKGIG